MLFVLSCFYFVGLVVTAVATGFLTGKPYGFLTLGLGLIAYSIAVGVVLAFSTQGKVNQKGS